MANDMCASLVPKMVNNLSAYSQWGINAMLLEQGVVEISLLNMEENQIGPYKRMFQKNWIVSYHNDLPVSLGITKKVSICGNHQCYIATNEVVEALGFLKSSAWLKGA